MSKRGTAEGFIPLEPCDLKLLAKVILIYPWSPGVFKDNYRNKDNFIYSDFIGFDVDNTEDEYTLEQAIEDWSDSECVIALSKSHQKEKVTGNQIYPARDRFRIVTRWINRIDSLDVYYYNMQQILKYNSHFDQVCVDPSRMFYPCTKIVYENYEGIRQPVQPLPPKPLGTVIKKYMAERSTSIKPNVLNFIKHGKVFGGSRNISVYVSTLELLNYGMDSQKVLELLQNSPFDRREFSEQELRDTFVSASKRYLSQK